MAEFAERRELAWPAVDWLRPLPPLARYVFRGDGTARERAGAAFGVALPELACRVNVQRDRAALWLGPDEHLLLAPAPGANALETALAASLGGQPHALVDVSHRQVAFVVQGPHAEWLLQSQCPLPLDGREFPRGTCTRTAFAKAEIVLWRTDEHTFHVEVWRSYAPYVVALLQQVARELEDA